MRQVESNPLYRKEPQLEQSADMRLSWIKKHARTFGIIGPSIIAIGTLVSLWRYHLGGGDSHPFYYWPVSGLGDHNVAPWPMVFNGCIISGALWDLRKALVAKLGQDAGVAKSDRLWWEGIRRAVDIPSMYPAVLVLLVATVFSFK